MRFFRSEDANYQSYKTSYLHPFEKLQIMIAIDNNIISADAIEIIEKWESENEEITEYNYEMAESELGSKLQLTGKLVFASEVDAETYADHTFGKYIVEYSGENAVYMGTEPDTGAIIYHIENLKILSKRDI